MLSERALYLINAEIDGALESGEQAELEAILESSEEARVMRAELGKLVSLLDETPQQEPPADLARRIVEQLPAPSRRSGFSLSGLQVEAVLDRSPRGESKTGRSVARFD